MLLNNNLLRSPLLPRGNIEFQLEEPSPMRFARVANDHEYVDTEIDRLVSTADLDVLQLDYRWPHGYPPEGIYAAGFLRQLRTLHKAMFLNPQLHVITNAGGGNPLGCVEAVAEFLCESGSADLPLTLIRGNNLLPRLDELLEVVLGSNDSATGKSVKEQSEPFLAAHVEIGAGPLATALSEGSRLVIAGCYDLAAPAIAATVDAHHVPWDDYNALADVAVAANVPHRFLEIEPSGEVVIHGEAPSVLQSNRSQPALDRAGMIHHADVSCHVGNFFQKAIVASEFTVSGVVGKAASEMWRLSLTTGNKQQLVCSIPRDAIAVSVDTRPAHEWR